MFKHWSKHWRTSWPLKLSGNGRRSVTLPCFRGNCSGLGVGSDLLPSFAPAWELLPNNHDQIRLKRKVPLPWLNLPQERLYIIT